MTDSSLKAWLDYAKSQVAQARNQPRTGSPQAGIALAYGLELLGRVIEGVQSDLEGGELVEVAIVYETLATETARLLELAEPEAFRALVELCDDNRARLLLTGQPAASAEVLELLRQRLVWLTVTYDWPSEGPSRRVVEIVHHSAAGALRSCTATQSMEWQELPDRVRARMLGGTDRKVRYQLFPATAGKGEGE
ncbi:hypothetical protein [Kitasatospora phosalacinea]|uniref:Uncharacterized protein n=1 Tax=Kitasatospora phosalacinea TaxID=2065 RepID=A0ABW6GEZ1_9ACTN